MNKQFAAVAVKDNLGRLLLSRPRPETYDLVRSPLQPEQTYDEAARSALVTQAGLYIGVIKFVATMSIVELDDDFHSANVDYKLFTASESDIYDKSPDAPRGLQFVHPSKIRLDETTQLLRESLGQYLI